MTLCSSTLSIANGSRSGGRVIGSSTVNRREDMGVAQSCSPTSVRSAQTLAGISRPLARDKRGTGVPRRRLRKELSLLSSGISLSVRLRFTARLGLRSAFQPSGSSLAFVLSQGCICMGIQASVYITPFIRSASVPNVTSQRSGLKMSCGLHRNCVPWTAVTSPGAAAV